MLVVPDPTTAFLDPFTTETTLVLICNIRDPLTGHARLIFGDDQGVFSGVDNGDGTLSAGIGTARFGVEYALGLEDADVRIGGGVLGAMPGPADREVADLRGYAMFGGSVAIGF